MDSSARLRVAFREDELHRTITEQSRDDYFSADGSQDGLQDEDASAFSRTRASLQIAIPPNLVKADMAFTALQYLPMPVLVLSSTKTIVLANEAMGRLLGIDPEMEPVPEESEENPFKRVAKGEVRSSTDILYGTSMSQLGLDLLQNGNPVFVSWDNFLDTVVDDAARSQCRHTQLNMHRSRPRDKDSTPTGRNHRRSVSTASSSKMSNTSSGTNTEVHDAVVNVVFSTNRDPRTGLPSGARNDASDHISSQLIVSVWATEDEQYFTLTFTASSLETVRSPSSVDGTKTTSRTVSRTPTSYSNSAPSGLSSSSSSSSQSGLRRSIRNTPPASAYASPTVAPVMEFPPKGPPSKASQSSAPTMFSKTNRLKEAILNSMDIPAYAMWKDESFGIPNKAAVRMIYPWIEDGKWDSSEQARDFLSHYHLYRDDFTEEIPMDEFPIMRLMRLRERFEGYRIGMYSVKDGSRVLYDTSGEPIYDEKGEFLGGLVLFHDVTDYAQTIKRQQQQNERQFEHICNMIPQMIWRGDPEGMINYYSDGWYTYTGMSVEESMGVGWTSALDPDDLQVATPKWLHSVKTGDEYITEYQIRSAHGDWRWFLGRAVPMMDENRNILNWFGTCTDIHEQVLAREDAKQMKAQLERVIEHAQITLWAVDNDLRLTLAEGRPMHAPDHVNQETFYHGKNQYTGRHIDEIFRLQGRSEEMPIFLKPINDILAGKIQEDTIETQVSANGRWYRTRLYPLLRQERKGGIEGDWVTDGVVGVSMDVTELRKAAEEVAERDRENARLMAQSVAAKEASKMKSQFLANMSHEIRTPIAGVIGMSELLLDDESGGLTKEQRDCAENIQRSANGLLTVINDILDFSKVESGRLDIEEVQFDLSVVIRDVNKMLGFAAERKGLKYVDDIQQLKSWKVLGNPGRLRQVMTNLLTNSIKFTSEGTVAMRVKAQKETADMVEVHFTVEDTGIGIEEEVRRKLFKPFSQADSSTARRFGGTGLGLTISKNLVELMHGKIALESKLGVGTKASFWIPFHKAPYQTSESALVDLGTIPDRLASELSVSRPTSENSGPSTPTIRHRREGSTSGIPGYNMPWPDGSAPDFHLSEEERREVNVLVVEDNPINQQIALKTIGKLGFPVRAVWNGKEAIDYLQSTSEDQPRPDIILMDVQMPIMDGYKATYTIRNAQPFASNPDMQGTPIVAMTASAIQGDREKCQAAGMDDYLAKPVKKPNLEKMLVKWAIEGRKKRVELRKNPHLLKTADRPNNPRKGTSFISDGGSSSMTSQDHLTSELDRLQFVHQNIANASSESEDQRAARAQAAEEQAISLRDHELIEAGEDPKTKMGKGVDEEEIRHEESTPTALTTENMERFASADPLAKLKRQESGLQSDASSMVATKAETTGSVLPSVSNSAPRTGAMTPDIGQIHRRSVG